MVGLKQHAEVQELSSKIENRNVRLIFEVVATSRFFIQEILESQNISFEDLTTDKLFQLITENKLK